MDMDIDMDIDIQLDGDDHMEAEEVFEKFMKRALCRNEAQLMLLRLHTTITVQRLLRQI